MHSLTFLQMLLKQQTEPSQFLRRWLTHSLPHREENCPVHRCLILGYLSPLNLPAKSEYKGKNPLLPVSSGGVGYAVQNIFPETPE